MMLQFTKTENRGLVFINPVHVSGVDGIRDDESAVHTIGGATWYVEGNAADVQLRIWKGLE